MTHTTS